MPWFEIPASKSDNFWKARIFSEIEKSLEESNIRFQIKSYRFIADFDELGFGLLTTATFAIGPVPLVFIISSEIFFADKAFEDFVIANVTRHVFKLEERFVAFGNEIGVRFSMIIVEEIEMSDLFNS